MKYWLVVIAILMNLAAVAHGDEGFSDFLLNPFEDEPTAINQPTLTQSWQMAYNAAETELCHDSHACIEALRASIQTRLEAFDSSKEDPQVHSQQLLRLLSTYRDTMTADRLSLALFLGVGLHVVQYAYRLEIAGHDHESLVVWKSVVAILSRNI